MKIIEIEPILLERRLKEPVNWPTGSSEISKLTLLKVTTDDDLIGWGTAPDIQSIDNIKSIFIGQDPFDREALWEKIGWRGTFQSRRLMQTLSGINIALYDIIGKAINQPVYKILGGAQHKNIKTYMNGLYFNTDEKIKKIVAEQLDRGFTAVKLKIGYPKGIKKDIEKVEMLRKEFGYDIDILVDACRINWNANTAIKIGRELEKYQVYWLEEPLPQDDIDGYVEITRALDIMITGLEGICTRYEFRNPITRRAIDVVMADLGICGGIDESRKIASMASAYTIPFSPHGGDIIKTVASLHVSATVSNFLILEYTTIPPEWLSEDLLEDPLNFKKGYLKLPSKPGLGINLNEKIIERERIN
jgi:L-alanine-DL-glutamate epimerase-like enolase superfamily enzyme